MNSLGRNYSLVRWIVLSLVLLALYLGFFHTVTGQSPRQILVTGMVFTALSIGIVVLCRKVFINRFEYWAHLVIGLDVFLESFITIHETTSFYYCAAAFWGVFWVYHAACLVRRKLKAGIVEAGSEMGTGPVQSGSTGA